MFRLLVDVLSASAMSFGLHVGTSFTAQAQTPSAAVVDVNGPHIIVRGLADARDWSGTTVELNSYWIFKVGRLPKMKDLCINAAAFSVKESIRAGRDFTGVHYEPSEMNVKSVAIHTEGGAPVPIKSVTSGMIKPLTDREAAVQCIGKVQ